MGLTITTGVAPAAYVSSGATGTAATSPAPAQTPAPEAVQTAPSPTVQTAVQSQAAETAQAKTEAVKTGGEGIKHKDAVTITYDNQAGVNVFKSYDSKGNVVIQVPPSQLLKTMELEGKSKEEILGQVINTKA